MEILKVETIMVVGHYGCSGVQAVAEHRSTGLADNWLCHVEDVAHKHAALRCSVQSALGCAVTFKWARRRVPCSMTTNTYSIRTWP